MLKPVEQDDAEAFTAANLEFHTQIYLGAHNDIIADFATSLRRRLAPFRRAQFQTEGRLSRSHEEHRQVVKAIVAGNSSAAHAAMFDHMSLVEQSFERLAETI
jgi:DNA-binding FadR family transcriptional regulator